MSAMQRCAPSAIWGARNGRVAVQEDEMEPFVVKHYSADERPTLKGNGFDGLEIGETREEAEEFITGG